jgi:hypothetical protein
MAAGKLKRKFHIREGLDRAPEYLNELFAGRNTGKMFVFEILLSYVVSLTPFIGFSKYQARHQLLSSEPVEALYKRKGCYVEYAMNDNGISDDVNFLYS